MAYNNPERISLISTQTASTSASLSFTSGISSNFSTYLVKIRNITPATNNTQLLLTFSINGGSSYLSTNYLYSNLEIDPTHLRTYGKSAGTTSSIPLTIANISSTVADPLNADLILYNLASATFSPLCMFHSMYYSTTSSIPEVVIGGGMNTTTGSGVNAINFALNSGNISSGTISLYGLKDGGFLY